MLGLAVTPDGVGLRGGRSGRIQGAWKGTKSKMSKTLVVVESPAKAKTIKKYLGAGYEVLASKGHVKDLPKKMGIDVAERLQGDVRGHRGQGEGAAGAASAEAKTADVAPARDRPRSRG